jgi:hypothetical protein
LPAWRCLQESQHDREKIVAQRTSEETEKKALYVRFEWYLPSKHNNLMDVSVPACNNPILRGESKSLRAFGLILLDAFGRPANRPLCCVSGPARKNEDKERINYELRSFFLKSPLYGQYYIDELGRYRGVGREA